MPSIPEFDANGFLPVGVYNCDEAEFYEKFVVALDDSDLRGMIWEGFQRLREEAIDRGICGLQWIDGSFVSTEPQPGDIDVVTFIDYDELEGLEQVDREFVEDLLNGREASKEMYRTHAIVITCCGPEHPYFPVFESYRYYWLTESFGRIWQTQGPSGSKGFVAMALGPADQVPAVSTE